MNNVEIERKFLIKELPKNLESYKSCSIEQGYLCREPVVRIRKADDEYILTYKGEGLKERMEYNLPLTKSGYEHLREKVDGSFIVKTRYFIPIENNLTVELDIFKAPRELILAEVEFDSVEDSEAFEMPDWFEADVTNDRQYHNSNM